MRSSRTTLIKVNESLQVTNNSNPPPGFKFVPIGDPLLTSECKELSRERDAMIFIVSVSNFSNMDMYGLLNHVTNLGFERGEFQNLRAHLSNRISLSREYCRRGSGEGR